jgi:hypothetical protein
MIDGRRDVPLPQLPVIAVNMLPLTEKEEGRTVTAITGNCGKHVTAY